MRELQLRQAEAALKTEKAALRRQQARVTAARRALDRLSRCDSCGARTVPTGSELQLCWPCTEAQLLQDRKDARAALLQGSQATA